MVDPHCRAKYNLDDFRKQNLMRLRHFLNDILLDQLPVLTDMRRMLDELALNCQPNLEGYSKGNLVIEQVRIVQVIFRTVGLHVSHIDSCALHSARSVFHVCCCCHLQEAHNQVTR